MKDKVFVIIPAFNEGSAIAKVIFDLKKSGYENIVVVDDCSVDNTSIVSENAGAVVLSHVINRGQGAALKTGTNYALENGADIIVHFDADGQMQVFDIKKMIKPVIDGEVDITLGSRFLGSVENIDFMKKVVLKIARLVVFILYGIWLTDSQNGFRAMNRYAAEKIEITSDRMEHAGEILGEINAKNLKFREIPVKIIYTDYSMSKGQSWKKSFSLGIKMFGKRMLKR